VQQAVETEATKVSGIIKIKIILYYYFLSTEISAIIACRRVKYF